MRYYVEEFIPCIQVLAKYVDADSAEEALELFESMDTDPVVFKHDDHDYDNIEYRVFRCNSAGYGIKLEIVELGGKRAVI